MSVLAGVINTKAQVKADEFDDYKQDQLDAVAYLENIHELLASAKGVLLQLDEVVENAFNENAYVYNGEGLRVAMGADALKASGIERVIPVVEKQIKELKQNLRK